MARKLVHEANSRSMSESAKHSEANSAIRRRLHLGDGEVLGDPQPVDAGHLEAVVLEALADLVVEAVDVGRDHAHAPAPGLADDPAHRGGHAERLGAGLVGDALDQLGLVGVAAQRAGAGAAEHHDVGPRGAQVGDGHGQVLVEHRRLALRSGLLQVHAGGVQRGVRRQPPVEVDLDDAVGGGDDQSDARAHQPRLSPPPSWPGRRPGHRRSRCWRPAAGGGGGSSSRSSGLVLIIRSTSSSLTSDS